MLLMAFGLLYTPHVRVETAEIRDFHIKPVYVDPKQLHCMAKNIFYEAGGESIKGQAAVARVVLNRVAHGFANTPCNVIYQTTVVDDVKVCQFSWVCENKKRVIPIHDKQWNESQEVAKKVLLEHFRLPSLTNSLYFHADYVNPKWSKEKITKIDRHIFYKDKQ